MNLGRMAPTRTARLVATLLIATLLLAIAATACRDSEGVSAEDLQEVEDIVKETVESDGSNADFFFAHATDNVIERVLFSSRDECAAAASECIGEPLVIQSLSGTSIDGDTATTSGTTELGTFEVGLVREDGVWKVDSLRAVSDQVPPGAVVVELELSDFAFVFDEADVPAGGNFAFRARNGGAQAHEVVVIGIPPGATVEDALAAVASEEVPPVGLKIFIQPGQQVDMAFEAPLDPGDYALVCFFPDVNDPERSTHFQKGMSAGFTVE